MPCAGWNCAIDSIMRTLDVQWADVTGMQLYTVHDVHPLLEELILPRLGEVMRKGRLRDRRESVEISLLPLPFMSEIQRIYSCGERRVSRCHPECDGWNGEARTIAACVGWLLVSKDHRRASLRLQNRRGRALDRTASVPLREMKRRNEGAAPASSRMRIMFRPLEP
jgi:hypothetical protein